MRAVRYYDGGAPDVLQLETIDRPEPGPGEVLVEIRAASVNPVDAKFGQAGLPRLPKTTGSDLAGVVAAVGEGVDAYAEGDRVFATGLHTGRFAGGSFADHAAVPTDLLAPLPDAVSFEAGAAVALVGVTDWRAFVHHAGLEPGETAFVHGGNGGVGHVAVGLAAALGATPVATARPEHHDTVRELGAATVLDYERDDLADAARTAVGDAGADVVLDHMPGQYVGLDADVAAFEGDIVVIAGEDLSLSDVAAARGQELDLHMMSMSNLATHSDMPDIGPILEQLAALLADDRLAVRIDRTYPLEEAAEAHRAVLKDSVVGKILVTP
jgi:NADPH:quinone reductase-like Zn-dependent oxidoreductase